MRVEEAKEYFAAREKNFARQVEALLGQVRDETAALEQRRAAVEAKERAVAAAEERLCQNIARFHEQVRAFKHQKAAFVSEFEAAAAAAATETPSSPSPTVKFSRALTPSATSPTTASPKQHTESSSANSSASRNHTQENVPEKLREGPIRGDAHTLPSRVEEISDEESASEKDGAAHHHPKSIQARPDFKPLEAHQSMMSFFRRGPVADFERHQLDELRAVHAKEGIETRIDIQDDKLQPFFDEAVHHLIGLDVLSEDQLLALLQGGEHTPEDILALYDQVRADQQLDPHDSKADASPPVDLRQRKSFGECVDEEDYDDDDDGGDDEYADEEDDDEDVYDDGEDDDEDEDVPLPDTSGPAAAPARPMSAAPAARAAIPHIGLSGIERRYDPAGSPRNPYDDQASSNSSYEEPVSSRVRGPDAGPARNHYGNFDDDSSDENF